MDDVQLPAWCQGDARLFILIHRQALESSWVRDHLQVKTRAPHLVRPILRGTVQSSPLLADANKRLVRCPQIVGRAVAV